jgi:hypothetical protein
MTPLFLKLESTKFLPILPSLSLRSLSHPAGSEREEVGRHGLLLLEFLDDAVGGAPRGLIARPHGGQRTAGPDGLARGSAGRREQSLGAANTSWSSLRWKLQIERGWLSVRDKKED